MVAPSLRATCVLLLLVPTTTRADDQVRREVPLKLGDVPIVKPNAPAREVPAQAVRDLITALAAMDKPDVGLSSTLSGEAFAPLPAQRQAGVMLLAPHELATAKAFRDLVELGPAAMPHLLAALDDRRKTKIVIKHDGAFGVMEHADELDQNPVNPREAAVWEARSKRKRDDASKHVSEYVVKVGDVCFVILGQITGRGYEAVRYQPTACVVLNCPTETRTLSADVRAVWTADAPRDALLTSLITDHSTQGVFNGRSLDGWGYGNRLQCGAALRLAYYFPVECAALLATRLDAMDVSADQGIDAYMKRAVANGVRSEQYVRSLAWCKDATIRRAMRGIVERAGHVDSLVAAVPAVDDPDLVHRRLSPLIADGEPDLYRKYKLLRALAQASPKSAREVWESFVRNADAERCATACRALKSVRVPWDVDVLLPLLNDKRTTSDLYYRDPKVGGALLAIRVCDVAATTLSTNHSEMKFEQAGSHEHLDLAIDVIRKQVRKAQPSEPKER